MASGDVIQLALQLDDKATGPLKKVGGAADVAGNQAKTAAKKFKLTKDNMKLMAAAAAGVIVGFGALVKSLAAAQHQQADTSTRTGLAVDTLAGLKLAAEGAGLQFDALSAGLIQFPKRMSDMARGTGEAKVAFEKLGISVLDAEGNLRSSDEVMKESLSRINGVEDSTTKAALASELFGRSGTMLLQALSGTELQEFVDEAERFGIKTGPSAAMAAADLQREIARFSLVSGRATQTLLEGFSGSGSAAGAVKAFGAILVGLSETFKGIMEIGRRTFGILTGTVTDLFMAIMSLGEAMVSVFTGDFAKASRQAKKSLAILSSSMQSTAKDALALLESGGILGAMKRGFDQGMAAFDAPTAGTGGGRGGARSQTELAQAEEDEEKVGAEKEPPKVDAKELEEELRQSVLGFQEAANKFAEAPFNSMGPEGFLKPLADPIGSMVGMMGPAGGLIQGISQLGQMGADAIKQMLIDFIDGFIIALVEVIPDLLVAIPEILIEKLPEVLGGILKAIPKILTALLWKLPKVIIIGAYKALKRMWGAVKSFFESLFSFGILQSGATITQSGLNYLHAGERVVPSSGASTQTADALMRGASNIGAGQTVQISTNVVDPNSIDQLARMLQRELGEFGSGRQLSAFNVG